jgi:hypothetical protein
MSIQPSSVAPMSWDIFVQDVPDSAKSVSEIPDDFRPQPIGSVADVLNAIRACIPFADFSDPTWVRVDGPGLNMEINIETEEPLYSFAFHVRGGDCSPGLIAEILERLHLRAFDPASDSGIFDPSSAAESLKRWQEYRDRVV